MKYNKLWQLLAERGYRVRPYLEKLHISSQTEHSMKNPGKNVNGHLGGNINLSVIDRICSDLKCQPSDIMELEETK